MGACSTNCNVTKTNILIQVTFCFKPLLITNLVKLKKTFPCRANHGYLAFADTVVFFQTVSPSRFEPISSGLANDIFLCLNYDLNLNIESHFTVGKRSPKYCR